MTEKEEELRAEIQRLRQQLHTERNEAAIQYGLYETQIRELKKELKNV